MKAEKGLALQDIIQGIFDFIHTVELPAPARIYVLDLIAQVESVSFSLLCTWRTNLILYCVQ